MSIAIQEFAKKHGLTEKQVTGALDELGIAHGNGTFEADADEVELILEQAKTLEGEADGNTLILPPNRTPRDLAVAMGKPDKDVLKTLMTKVKVMATLTTALQPAVAERLAKEYGFNVRWEEPKPEPKKGAKPTKPGAKTGEAVLRPPVVTILGHVDHGKTSLLDYIRKTNVVAKEHGGITQHIGAYQVRLPEGLITFLDTPGHAAFTAMRARGAQVTDIAILVVAADDGIMPQTIEAISHVKNADVPIIVAVNKVDKPEANPDRVLQQLTQYELIPESFGGEVITVPVSAVTGQGVPELLEMILLQAEVMELKANPRGDLEGVVIEAKLDKGRGPVATVLIEEGTLKIGDVVTVGNTWGKIKAMNDWKGERLKEAGPSTPVEILGLSEVPHAGDRLDSAKDERAGRDMSETRLLDVRNKAMTTGKRKVSLKDIRKLGEEDDIKDLNLIVKADVQGSVEAVKGLLDKIENEEVNVSVIHTGVGSVTESDILLASAANAIVVGFNVKPEGQAKAEAERQKVEIRTYNIIYELIEDIENAVKGMLEPKFEEQYMGTIEIRVAFKLSKAGKVAGSHCTDGKVTRNASVRVRRANEVVYQGKLASLRNVKEDVREIIAGQDCGMKFDGWEDFKEGDVVEAYELVQVN
ncbi:MAG: translation initiation factor IF-2 [Fimbriimonadaceae bacterium]|nr:translation initiation factor IF-2 [Fimbriimonadaceae bacterium]QYK55033.1 MAG: translation initiation factor IF-2 [Fimbriimonadaceae bacterium]